MNRWAFPSLVAALTLLSLARWPAVWYGYPFDGIEDERYLVDVAYQMAHAGDANPHFFNYPSLTFYLLAGLYWIASVLGGPLLEGDAPTPDHYVLARMLIVALGTAAVPLTAELGRRAAGPLAGLAAACFFAVAPLYTTFSYMATVNPVLAATCAFAGLAAFGVYERGATRDYVLAGVAAGLAVGTKYVAFPVAALPLLAHWLAHRERPRSWRPLLICMALVPVVLLSTSPFLVLDGAQALKDVQRTGSVYRMDGNWEFHQSEGSTSWAEIARRATFRSFRRGPMTLAGLGLAWLLWRARGAALLLALPPLATWLFLGSYKVFFPRNLMGALPFAAVLAGVGLVAARDVAGRVLRGARPLRWAATLLVFALALRNPLGETLATLREATLVDTRRAALDWVSANVPAGSCIVREEKTPPIDEVTDAYDVRYLRSIVRPDRRAEVEACDWVLLTVPFRRDHQLADSYAEDRRLYAEFTGRHELAAEFSRETEGLSGRRIAIYRIVRDRR